MAVVAHLAAEADRDEIDRVIDGFNEDLLTAYAPDPHPTDRVRFELRTEKTTTLAQFREACAEHSIILDIHGIYHDSGGTAGFGDPAPGIE